MAYDGDERDLDTSSSSKEERVIIAPSPAIRAHSADLAQRPTTAKVQRGAYTQNHIGRIFLMLRLRSTPVNNNEALDDNRVVSAPTANDNPHISLQTNSRSSGAPNKREESTSESSTESETIL